MKIQQLNKRRPRQQGAIFLALMLVLFVTGSTVVIGALNNRQSASIARSREVRYQMEQAKAALLAYAAAHADFFDDARGPGFFPCPDTDAPSEDLEGTPNYVGVPENRECTYDGTAPAMGRLPRLEELDDTTFRFNDAYADIDQQFWYVVAPHYVYSATATSNRSYYRTYADASSTAATSSWLSLDGDTKYVALLIAPGEELETQNRIAGPTDYSDYIDGLNGSDGFDFYTSDSTSPELFNDEIVGITHDEYMIYVGTAVAREVKLRVDEYYDEYPFYPFLSKRYPSNSGGSSTTTPNTTCTATSFSNIFDSATYGIAPSWLKDSTAGNGEYWSCTQGLTWTRTSLDEGYLVFNGCPDMIFEFEYGNALTRNGDACEITP